MLVVRDLDNGRVGQRAFNASDPGARPATIHGGRVLTLATRDAEQRVTLEFLSRDEILAIARGSP